jgi:phospholipase A1
MLRFRPCLTKPNCEIWQKDGSWLLLWGVLLLLLIKPMYVFCLYWSSNPWTLNQEIQIRLYRSECWLLQYIETKFQLSFKTKVLQYFFGAWWFMVSLYSKKSHWQIYNNLSRPFREVNYEPELILNFPVKFNLFGFKQEWWAYSVESWIKWSDPFPVAGTELSHAGFERKNWSSMWDLVPYASCDWW